MKNIEIFSKLKLHKYKTNVSVKKQHKNLIFGNTKCVFWAEYL